MNRRITRAAAVFALACAPAIASAQSFNIDFNVSSGPGAGVPTPTFAAAAGYSSSSVSNNYWNNVSSGVIGLPLWDTSATPTAATFTLSSAAVFGSDGTQLTGDFELLVADWTTPWSPFEFEGLFPGSYTVLTYVGSEGAYSGTTEPAASAPNQQAALYFNVPCNGFFSGTGLSGTVRSHTSHRVTVGLNGSLKVRSDFPHLNKVAGIQLIYHGISAPFPGGQVLSPAVDSCNSGTVQIIGTTDGPSTYSVEYSTSIAGPFTPLGSGNGGSTNAVLATWDTSTVPPGTYFIRLTVTAPGASPGVSLTSFKVGVNDSQPPQAALFSPNTSARVCGTVPITGTITDPNLTSWTLDYIGPQANQWTPIASGNTQVQPGALAQWNTSGLPRGAYVLRLRATDSGASACQPSPGQATESFRTVIVGLQSDISFDGQVNTTDLARLLGEFGFSCQ